MDLLGRIFFGKGLGLCDAGVVVEFSSQKPMTGGSSTGPTYIFKRSSFKGIRAVTLRVHIYNY